MSERTTTSEVLHVLPVVEEVPRIVRRRRVTGRVRIAITTSETSEAVEAVLCRRTAEVRYGDASPLPGFARPFDCARPAFPPALRSG